MWDLALHHGKSARAQLYRRKTFHFHREVAANHDGLLFCRMEVPWYETPGWHLQNECRRPLLWIASFSRR